MTSTSGSRFTKKAADLLLRHARSGYRASRIGVRPDVRAERMPALYAEHDVFVFPSLMEGLPSVLLEAMASGMPVITTETCGMTDVVENESNGLLIPPADSAALEQAVSRLAT